MRCRVAPSIHRLPAAVRRSSHPVGRALALLDRAQGLGQAASRRLEPRRELHGVAVVLRGLVEVAERRQRFGVVVVRHRRAADRAAGCAGTARRAWSSRPLLFWNTKK